MEEKERVQTPRKKKTPVDIRGVRLSADETIRREVEAKRKYFVSDEDKRRMKEQQDRAKYKESL